MFPPHDRQLRRRLNDDLSTVGQDTRAIINGHTIFRELLFIPGRVYEAEPVHPVSRRATREVQGLEHTEGSG